MTRPTARVLRLLELLQSAAIRTVRELAEQLGVDERTVRRYVEHLRDLEVPVESVRGRYGGYRIATGYRMPPLMLRGDEALAALLGLVEMRSSRTPLFDAAAVETALSKIRRSLPKPLDDQAAHFLELAIVRSPDSSTRIDPDLFLTIADSVRHRRPLAVTYRSRDGAVSRRTLHPYDVVAYGGRWYTTGLDARLLRLRTLRLDRIRLARTLPGTFPARASDDPAGEMIDRFARADYAHSVSLRVRATREHVEARLPSSVAVIEQLEPAGGEPTWMRVLIRAERLDWLPQVILGLACPVVIEGPAELREVVARAADTLSRIASVPGNPDEGLHRMV